MGMLLSFSVVILLFLGFCNLTICDQEGFLSLLCGGSAAFVDASSISWSPDTTYVTNGNTTTVDFIEGTSSAPVRFFPDSKGQNCYKIPVYNVSSRVLVRAQFMYRNYDGLGRPPIFYVSLGRALTTTINLTKADPWIEEFIWPIDKEILPLCFHSIPNGGFPVISSLEVRPLPQGSYTTRVKDFPNNLLRKCYRINCGFNNGSMRYPLDQYDRIWDADINFSPSHVSAAFDIQSSFDLSSIQESPPVSVLETARVLSKWDEMVYNFPFDNLGDYYVVIYFAGILPVTPSFDVLINGEMVQSKYIVKSWEASVLYWTKRGVKNLNVTLRTITFNPLVSAVEVYQIVDIPAETSSTTVSALQVIQQSTGLDLGWQEDPCSPLPWNYIGCEGNLVISLGLSGVNLRLIGPTFGDLLDLKMLDLHNTSLSGEIQNLGGLQRLEKL